MQTATLYTLQSKVIPVYDDESIRYLGHVDDVFPLYVEGGQTVFTNKALLKETYLPLHHVCKSFSVSREFPRITPPKPWEFLNSQEDLGSRFHEDIYHHLFAVDPELEKILRHVFNGEKVSEKIPKLEQEKVVEIDKFDKANQKCFKLEEKLKDVLSTNASLNERLLSTDDKLYELRRKVHTFCECNVFKRLWVAFRNDLVP